MTSETYNALNRAWKSTTKVVLGEELGELSLYAQWLQEYVDPPRLEQSLFNKRNVHLGIKEYSKECRFASLEEVNFSKEFEPVGINDLKDIDSVIEALRERFYYTGSVVLGNSKFVEESSNVVDSHFIHSSIIVSDSKYSAYSDTLKLVEYCFGVYGDAESSHIIKCTEGYRNKRNFECHATYLSSDCYYSANLNGCSNAMFSFGAQGKNHIIGNTELSKDKYLSLKSKLLAEIVEILRKEKKIFSLYEVIGGARGTPTGIPIDSGELTQSKSAIEKAFSDTSALVLGRKLSGIDNYTKLLSKHAPNAEVIRVKSPITGNISLMAGYFSRFARLYPIKGRVVSEQEIRKVSERGIGEDELEKLRADPAELSSLLGKIAFVSFESTAGVNSNMINCAIITNSSDCYSGTAYVHAKKCGYSFWPRHSEHTFGSCAAWNSAFAINSYYSKGLSRAFEVDSCDNSSDIYFSHNCENVHSSMFCFNKKNLKNSIGNFELGSERYTKLKSALLEQIGGEIEKNKDLRWSIYNISGKKA
ncbi:MAG: hypothetical protein ABIF01_01935 [Candidatus Micrarchaeota archaeon]